VEEKLLLEEGVGKSVERRLERSDELNISDRRYAVASLQPSHRPLTLVMLLDLVPSFWKASSLEEEEG